MSVTDRLYRRILMTSAGITISATNDGGPVHLVQGKVRGTPETIDNLQVVQLYGFASHAPPGSDAFVSFGNGDRSNGVVHATANQQARPRDQQPGEVSIHDDQGTIISLKRNGNIVITCSTKIQINAPLVEISGDLRVDGEIIRGYGTGHQVSLGQHTHTQGPDSGGDGEEPTNAPTSGT
jgi:phage gp45-like